MSLLQSYRMRLRRKRVKIRAYRKHFSLRPVANRTDAIRPGDILLFCTLRDEMIRLPYFMQYYRDLGVSHFLIVDNDSNDGGREYLASQSDVSLVDDKGQLQGRAFWRRLAELAAEQICPWSLDAGGRSG